jgi:phage terminase large subunit-like protein
LHAVEELEAADRSGVSDLRNEISLSIALLTPEERARYDLLVARARELRGVRPKSFREFVDFVTGGHYQWYVYAVVLAGVLQKMADKVPGFLRVLVFAPPRHGKSEAVSRLFPAYYLYRWPDEFFGLVSYGAQLANTLARTARSYYQEGAGVITKGTINQWETSGRGGMWSAGIGGPITGKGLNIGAIDDPVKNAEEAASIRKRTRDREWYQSTYYSRAEPDAAMLVMCTRWDMEDLPGWILEQEWENQDDPDALERWHIVNFEAIRESPEEIEAREAIDGRAQFPPSCTVEPDWRQPGEALAPERYPIEALLRIRKRIGEYFFGALYQQHPRIRQGGRFTLDMLPIVDDFPRQGIRMVRWWDKAATEGGGDYTAGVLMARDLNGIYYVVDVVHGQWGELKRDLIIKATTQVDVMNYGSLLHIWSEQEPGSAGVDQANAFRRLLDGYTVYTERTTGDKESYIGPLASTAQAGNLRLVRGPWNAVARREFLDYPGKLDDIIESAARAASKLSPRARSSTLPESVSQLSYN